MRACRRAGVGPTPVRRNRRAPRAVSLRDVGPLAAVVLALCAALGCGSAPAAREPSALRRQAERATQSGRAAATARQFESAARSFEGAADTFAALDDFAAEADARFERGEALRRAGAHAEVCASAAQALALDRALERRAAQARDLVGLARCERAQGDFARAVAHAEEALALAGGDPALEATVRSDLALHLLARGDSADQARILELLDAALHSARSAGNERAAAAAQLALGQAQLRFGAHAQAEAALLAALTAFRALDDPEGIALVHESLAVLFAGRDESRAALHREQAREGFSFLGDAEALVRLSR